MATPVDFYFDFSSPFGYIAAEKIDALVEARGRTVTWRPYLMGAVFKLTGGSPLVDQPLKGPYSRHDMLRTARLLGVPFRVPDEFSTGSVLACRAYYWLSDQDPALARRFAQALLRGYFAENRNLNAPEVVGETAASLGVDVAALTAAVQDQAVKDRLRAECDAAIARGVFGSPMFLVDDEMFWGTDRLDQLDRWLETGGW